MAQSLGRVLAYTLIPVAASLLGGLIAAFRPPGATLKSVIQHFAAGVVFAAAALELLPPVRAQSPWVAVGGFAIGIAAMAGLRWGTDRLERPGGRGANLGLIAATGLDLLIDGLVTGAGFAAGESTGLLLIIALVLEFLFLGLAVASELGQGAARWQVIATPTGLSLLTVGGAAVGFSLLGGVSSAILALVLAFGAVALMYLVTEELLVEAHESAERPWIAASFFVGFLIYLVIDELVARGG